VGDSPKQYWPLNAANLQNNMSLIGQLNTNDKDQWVVGAFANQVCYGFAEPQSINSDKTLYFLTIHGDGGEKLTFKALNTTTGEIKSLSQTMQVGVTIILPNDGFEHSINITDLTGRSLKKLDVSSGISIVDLNLSEASITAGVYLLSVTGGNTVKTIKIIKN
jgi:hypothetical protein